MNKQIYLDNAATTKVHEEVLAAMLPYFTQSYANPSAIYTFAGEAKKAVDAARVQTAKLINATGRLRQLRRRTAKKAGTSSQAKLSTTPYCIPANI